MFIRNVLVLTTICHVTPRILGRVWHERTVIVKKEDKGFGFTLSQERPVFVDKIYNGSSAHKAGILEGDRLIKVT